MATSAGSSNNRLSPHGPDPVASAHLASSPSQRPPNTQHQPKASSTYPRPLISTAGWEINSIISRSPNFRPVERVHYTAPNARVEIVIPEVERDGNPLIITGWNRHPKWPKPLFNIDWLKMNGDQNPTVRNVHNWTDFKITMDEFIERLHASPPYASADEQERLYGKDGDCPMAWTEWLAQSGAIPEYLLFHGSNDFLRFLPDKAKVQTLMCYTGIGDTFTPFHKDLCASSGQNLMCFSENSGSAFWFMTKSSAAPRVATYFHQLGHEVDLETHVMTIEELAKAPFDVYIAEQQVGDLVLVPPRSCHQVVNKGGITMKASWSRMSLSGLQTALWHELPIYHRVCRQEIYKVKSNIFHVLEHYAKSTEELRERRRTTSTENLKQLVCLFDEILASEFSVSRDSMPHVSQSEMSHTDNLHCDFCGADIFQSFFECDSCLPASSSGTSTGILPVGDGLVLCPLCYVEGRTCQCGEMQPLQCRPFSELLGIRDQVVKAIQRIDYDYTTVHGYLSEQPLRLLTGPDTNIFEAACKLLQKRQTDAKISRSCRARLSHWVPACAAIYCKTCHFSKCYTHLLELDSVHSVDAIILSDPHDGDVDWHQSHRNSSQQYSELRERAVEDEEKGARPNVSHRLVYLARTFTTCRAIAPEVTKHGWYDRFVQTTSIPIVNSPAKALVGFPDEIDVNEQCGILSLDNSPSNLSKPAEKVRDLQMADSRQTSTTPFTTSSAGGINEIQSPRQSSPTVIPNFPPPIVNSSPSPKLGTAQVLGTSTGTGIRIKHDISSYDFQSTPCSPSTMRLPLITTSLSSAVMDDPGNLSDLTDLPTEVDSPSQRSIPSSPSFPSAASLKTRLVNGSQLKSRLVFDGVEIPRPVWCSKKREAVSSSRRKRKRATGTLSSNIAGSSDSDDLPLVAQEVSSHPLPKRKRKTSQGPASRISPSPKRTHASLTVQYPPPPNNFLADALNQTFKINGTSAASRDPTRFLSSDAVPIVGSAIISSTAKPQYRDFGVQKNLNFTRNTTAIQLSEDMSSCIVRLQAENRDYQAQAETCKRECEVLRESLHELNRRYHTLRLQLHLPPALGGASHFTPHPLSALSTHPRWRFIADSRSQTTNVPSPLSPEGFSAPLRRQTTIEPRNLKARPRRDVQCSQTRPGLEPRQCSRRHDPVEPTNGRRRRGKPRGPSSFLRGETRIELSLAASNSATVAAGVSGTSSRIDATVARDCDEVHDKC